MLVVANGSVLLMSSASVEAKVISLTNIGTSPLTDIVCTLRVMNSANVHITDGSRTLQNAVTNVGSVTYNTPDPGMAVWSFPSLAVGATETIDIQVLVVDATDVGSPWKIRADVTVAEDEADIMNNQSERNFNVLSCLELNLC